MAKKRVGPDAGARWAEESVAFREMYERRLGIAGLGADEKRRWIRLRRLTSARLGRAS